MKMLTQVFAAQGTKMQNTSHKQEKELKEVDTANNNLKQVLANQEQFTKIVCEQKNQLEEKVAVLEGSVGAANNLVKELKTQLEGAVLQTNNLKVEIQTANGKNQSLEKEMNKKIQLLTKAETEIKTLKLQLTNLRTEKLQVLDDLTKMGDANKALEVKKQELIADVVKMAAKIVDIEVKLTECRKKAIEIVQEMSSIIESKNRKLDSMASNISELTAVVETGSDVRARHVKALEMMKKEIDVERETMCERERKMGKQIEQLKCSIRSNDQELSNRRKIILELRGDKERLQEMLQKLNTTINNIQNHLGEPDSVNSSGRRENVQPVQDIATTAPLNTQPDVPVPKNDPRFYSVVLKYLGRSTMDEDRNLDAGEVTRRFEARSREVRVSPIPCSSRKRRHGTVAPAQGGLQRMTININNDQISLPRDKDEAIKKERKETNPKK